MTDEVESQNFQDSSRWELRYPNLAKYLNVARALIVSVTALECFAFALWGLVVCFSTDARDDEDAFLSALAIWFFGGLFVGIQYVVSMASLEFMFVFLSIEQETVESRKMLRILTAGSDRSDTARPNVESLEVVVDETAKATVCSESPKEVVDDNSLATVRVENSAAVEEKAAPATVRDFQCPNCGIEGLLSQKQFGKDLNCVCGAILQVDSIDSEIRVVTPTAQSTSTPALSVSEKDTSYTRQDLVIRTHVPRRRPKIGFFWPAFWVGLGFIALVWALIHQSESDANRIKKRATSTSQVRSVSDSTEGQASELEHVALTGELLGDGDAVTARELLLSGAELAKRERVSIVCAFVSLRVVRDEWPLRLVLSYITVTDGKDTVTVFVPNYQDEVMLSLAPGDMIYVVGKMMELKAGRYVLAASEIRLIARDSEVKRSLSN
jgi:hypothetical protein